MCNGRELWKDLVHLMNGEQFNMEEAGGRGGGGVGERWRERVRERTMVEWWDGARMQNKCLIN